MPLADAVARLTRGLAPVAMRSLPLAEAVGRIAAMDLRAEADAPARPQALRDGWAVRGDDVLGASPYAPILLTQPAIWVDAGADLPEGADAVLPPEAVEGRSVVDDAPAGAGMRGPGDDVRAGSLLVEAGACISPLQCLALKTAGIADVPVRLPRLRLVVAGAAPDTLSPLIAALARGEGAEVTDIVHVTAEAEAIAEAIQATDADAVLMLGGTGFGRNDHSAAGLARAGHVQAHGIALRPGETAGFGEAGGRPVLLLPGRPDAALAVFIVLGRPLMRALSGAAPATAMRAPILRKLTSGIGLSEIVFARREPDGLMPLGGADLPLASLIAADAAILVASEAEGHPAGTDVAMLPL